MDDIINNEGNAITKIYRGVETHHDQIFTSICVGKTKVQDCNDADKKVIFSEIPTKFNFFMIALVEESMKCSGLDMNLTYYYFTK